MKMAKVLTYQVVSINNRENDSPMFVYEKLTSIINGCKTYRQLHNAYFWAKGIFYARFPGYGEFLRKLRWTYYQKFDEINSGN